MGWPEMDAYLLRPASQEVLDCRHQKRLIWPRQGILTVGSLPGSLPPVSKLLCRILLLHFSRYKTDVKLMPLPCDLVNHHFGISLHGDGSSGPFFQASWW